MTEKLMIRALKGEATDRIPLWLMRQAGRYLPEYRALRAEAGSFMNLCFTPEKAAEVTLQPIRRFDFDAAIMFSDILVIPYALGQSLTFAEGEGPKLGALNPDALDLLSFEDKLLPIYETLRLVKKDLAPEKTLIGFAGAPWTVLCYMIQGGGNKTFDKAKAFARDNPGEFHFLLDAVTSATSAYLVSQIRAGADTVQIFDSWAGLCPEENFEEFIVKPMEEIVDSVRAACDDVPIIGFPRGIGDRTCRYCEVTAVDAIGIDQANTFAPVPKNVCIQGNLDPEILLKGGEDQVNETARILAAAEDRPFVFNLGHGIIKETPPDHVAALAAQVKAFRR